MGLQFEFSSEQQMLAASVRGVLARAAGPAEPLPSNLAPLARQVADHGLFGVFAPAAAGGLGLGLTEALAISMETGRAHAPYPVIETIMAARLLADTRPSVAAQVMRGELIATCASSGEVEVVANGGQPLLRGSVMVPFAHHARWLALPVQRADRNEPGSWAAVVDLAGRGVSISPASEFDLTYPVFRVALGACIEPTDIVACHLAPALAVLACGELTGAAEHCLERTLRYLKERVQFGKPIGTNQGLKHAAADDWMRVQGMLAASQYAAASFDNAGNPGGVAEFTQAAHVAKAYCSAAARAVAEHAIQMHGGIAFTWEFGLHVSLRRILRLATALGSVADHYDALAAALLNGRTQ